MLASCSGDKTVRIWRPLPAQPSFWHCSAILEDVHSRTIRSCCWSPDGSHLATASFDRSVAIWENSVRTPVIVHCGGMRPLGQRHPRGSDLPRTGGLEGGVHGMARASTRLDCRKIHAVPTFPS